uniref:Uncharacterized protein n=1 Tax=Oryza sativa subsp. japonica TaxID=39947 RepID=Q6ZL53_ORYSJ|nr:hypothetical protein [Oryza sativa Japonica Group]
MQVEAEGTLSRHIPSPATPSGSSRRFGMCCYYDYFVYTDKHRSGLRGFNLFFHIGHHRANHEHRANGFSRDFW